jgi:hypothetical protein
MAGNNIPFHHPCRSHPLAISYSVLTPKPLPRLLPLSHWYLSLLKNSPLPSTFLNTESGPELIVGTEESLLTLRTLGIQTRSLSPCYLFPATTRFIPTSQIVDILIHEAFRGFEVRYYLAVVVEGEGAVVVVFPVSQPYI